MWHKLDRELASRRERHLVPGSWADIARALETTEQRVNNWKRRGVPAAQYATLASIMGWSVDRLLGVDDASERTADAASGKRHISLSEAQKVAAIYADLSPTERRRFLHLLAAARDDAPVLGDNWEQLWTSQSKERVIDETDASQGREQVINESAARAPGKKRGLG